jgi:ribosomal protein L37AE/L43A
MIAIETVPELFSEWTVIAIRNERRDKAVCEGEPQRSIRRGSEEISPCEPVCDCEVAGGGAQGAEFDTKPKRIKV